MAIITKQVQVNDVVLGKLVEQTNAGRSEPLTEDEVLQGRIDAEATKVKTDLLIRAFRALSEENRILALDAVNANPLV